MAYMSSDDFGRWPVDIMVAVRANVGGSDLFVDAEVAIEREGTERTEESSTVAAVEREHRTRETCAGLQVQDSKFDANLPVRHLLVLGVGRETQSLVLAGPPTSKLHVVVLVGAVGRFGSRAGSGSSAARRARGRRRARSPRSPDRSSSPRFRLFSVNSSAVSVSLSRRASPTSRERNFTSARRRSASWSSARCSHVHREDLVHHLGRDAATGQGGLHDIGFTAQSDEINHAHQPTEHVRANSKDALGSVVVSNAVQVTNLSVRFRRTASRR